MKNIKVLICNEIITKGNRKNILSIINTILNCKDTDNTIDILVELYINHDKYYDDLLFIKFKEGIEIYYNEKFYPKKCLAYLLKQEIEKILDKTYTYFNGFSNMIEIIKIYNRYDNLTEEENKIFFYGDIFAETISYELSELLSDFDITEDVVFSDFEEDISIKKINSIYLETNIDNDLKNILIELNNVLNIC